MLLKSDLNSNKHNLIQQFDFYCNIDSKDIQIRASLDNDTNEYFDF